MKRLERKAKTVTRAGALCGLWLLGLGLLLGACRDPAKASGTALFVTIDFPPTLLMDQIRISATVEDSNIGPHLLPEEPERLLANGDSFRLLLPSVADQSQAEVRIEGLANGTPVALGTEQAQVREGYEVEVPVRLEPWSPDGGEPDGGTPDGGTDGGTPVCANCPNGCCMGGSCTTSTFNTCGTGGVACVMCDTDTANACNTSGACVCGQNPACDPVRADRCANGQCRCGGNAMCDPGQQCVGGQCRCSPSSCDGCCVNNLCAPGNWRTLCGKGGSVCKSCNKNQTCSADGTCT
ncbi:hypothetical protein [Hyalangium rubrum]|uniref:Lipoprotein n=1 Tax=Hyalangium rubrum TaxID=3103134 RepID=A0ABU5GXL4_9BACT|nr:hypothetical protein [Hyalangium sp. s54d21]MDY7225936.1 hypothetical protein [Hyalangium sp. s54d21]